MLVPPVIPPRLTPPLGAVIFDLDGVLLDTEPLYTQATQEVVGAFGKVYDFALKRRIMGSGQRAAAEFITRELAVPLSVDEYRARVELVLERLFLTTPAMPGAELLVRELLQKRIPVAIATSTERELYRKKAQSHGWLSEIAVIVTGDDPEVTRPKPEPFIFLAAAARLGVPSERCVVVEDSPNGILAARRAGMQVIALPDERLEPHELGDFNLLARSHSEVAEALRAAFAHQS